MSHENGALECAQGSFKRRLDQALKLRGSGDFAAIKDYQAFLDTVTERLNKRCQSRFKNEQLALQALPGERFIDYSELSLKVTRSSTLEVKRVLYTVPSRLIGENVRVYKLCNFLKPLIVYLSMTVSYVTTNSQPPD